MRILLTALLIFLYAGAHTAAAFSMPSAGAATVGQSVSDGTNVSASLDAAVSHHLKCCEASGKSDTSAKAAGCSADCLSFFVDSIVYRFRAEATCESRPLRVLSALIPDPRDRPPRHG
ncbi:hypothetical protein [Roseibium sp.]|uniref:hypothetical protein n=1 Tax=Roseibium sp. TaxID=1936156 RepID=UPI003D14B1A6